MIFKRSIVWGPFFRIEEQRLLQIMRILRNKNVHVALLLFFVMPYWELASNPLQIFSNLLQFKETEPSFPIWCLGNVAFQRIFDFHNWLASTVFRVFELVLIRLLKHNCVFPCGVYYQDWLVQVCYLYPFDLELI